MRPLLAAHDEHRRRDRLGVGIDAGCDAWPTAAFPPSPGHPAVPAELAGRTRRAVEALVHASHRKARAIPGYRGDGDGDGGGAGVNFGIKAPVAMALLPFFASVVDRVSFIHVVRDGRDIAFSANQSPVLKFYNATFGPECWAIDRGVGGAGGGGSGSASDADLGALRAARMWAHWNSELLGWEREHASLAFAHKASGSGGGGVGVGGGSGVGGAAALVLRIEDVLGGDNGHGCTHRRQRALEHVASFVGAPPLRDELCCICDDPLQFMGPSVRTPNTTEHFVSVDGVAGSSAGTSGGMRSRGDGGRGGYGKWRRHLRERPLLSAPLHEVTGPTLEAFGYGGGDGDVEADMEAAHGEGTEACPLRARDECMRSKLAGAKRHAEEWEDAGCGYLAHVSVVKRPYPAEDAAADESEALVLPSSNTAHCCELCRREPRCAFFSRNHPTGACSLLRQPETFMRDSSAVLGWPLREGP